MKISIIIPTYKPQVYLWKCLESIGQQTFLKDDFEVILVLNGEKEPYNTQIRKYVAESMSAVNIRYIYTDVAGVSNARNLALDVARGEYVTFIDDDDFVSPQYLEKLYSCVDCNTVSLCYPYAFNDGHPQKQLPYNLTDVYDKYHLRRNNTISSKVRKYFSGPCMKLIPMSFIQGRRFDVRLKNGEDTLFMFLISDKIRNIVFADQEAVYYRRNRVGSAVNVSRSYKNILSSNWLQIEQYCAIYLKTPHKYNFCFFVSRILGALCAIMTYKLKRRKVLQ